MPDPRLGEEVGAWIKLKQGEQASEMDIKDFCKGNVSGLCAFLFVCQFALNLFILWSLMMTTLNQVEANILILYLVIFYRSLTSRFRNTLNLSMNIPSPSQGRCVAPSSGCVSHFLTVDIFSRCRSL